MRFNCLLVFVLLSGFLTVFVGCETQQAKSETVLVEPTRNLSEPSQEMKTEVLPAVEQAVPQLTFVNTIHDFGDVVPDSYNNCLFKFTNTGKGVLKIGQTKGTCKCTVPALKKKEYQPGESGQISVKFHAPKYQGGTSQHIYVSSNDPVNPKIELMIKANVKTYVLSSPDKLSLSLVEPNAGVGEITLSSIDGERFAIKKIVSSNNVMTIAFDPNNVSDKHVLKPKVKLERLGNFLNGAITISVNHPKCKNVRVQYSCLKEFETVPAALLLRDAVGGVAQKRTIYLTSNYNQEIKVDSVVSKKGFIKVIDQREKKNSFEFDVEITPPDTADGKKRYFSDTLNIKLAGKNPVKVSCRGFYKIK